LFTQVIVEELASARKNVESSAGTLVDVADDFEHNEAELIALANFADRHV
jgi:hypothetical protein